LRRKVWTLTCLVALACFPGLLSAGVLYSNTPAAAGWAANTDAWTINFGYSVSDSFTVGSASTARGIGFLAWAFTGDTMTFVDWAIGTSTFGVEVASGTAPVSTSPFVGLPNPNSLGYALLWVSFGIPDTGLSSGTTYWLTLGNAVVPSGDPIYWDQNDGPSAAWENGMGNVAGYQPCLAPCTDSETFLIADVAYPGQSGISLVPEPASLALVGGGLLLAAALRRRRA